MDETALLDTIEAAILEDPRPGLALAEQNPIPGSARYWALVGNGLRALGRYREAELALGRALATPATPFERADAKRKLALVYLNQRKWAEAFRTVADAVELHGQEGLSGPPDRGLPGLLLLRGICNFCAHTQGVSLGDPVQAREDFRRALELAPDPDRAPLTHVHAVHNLAVLATSTGQGLTSAQGTLVRVRSQLAALGYPRTSPSVARVQWASAVVDWILNGSSREVGHRFNRRIERALRTAHAKLSRSGAAYDALLVALDLGLLLLEHRRQTKTGGGYSSAQTEPAPRWDDLRELTLEAFRLDWTEHPDVASAVIFWRQASLEESLPAPALDFIYGKVRGLRKPDPQIHAHGTRWGGGIRPDAQSAVFQLSQAAK